MTNTILSTLETFRTQLQDCTKPVDIGSFRDDLVRDMCAQFCCGNESIMHLLMDLKETEKRVLDLEAASVEAKPLDNKMVYSTVNQQIEVAKNRVKELHKEINHRIRQSETMIKNQKRIKIEIERLDTIAFKTIKELPDLSTLENATIYTPLMSARDESHQTMNNIIKELDETAKNMGSEQIKHRDVIQEMKRDIKRTKAGIVALRDGTHPMQTAFNEDLSNTQSSRSSDINGKLKTLKDEIEKLKVEIAQGQTIHEANLTALEHNRSNLSQQLTETKDATAASMNELERKLSSLTIEQSTICAALEKLVERQDMEMKEEEVRKEHARILADEKAKAAAREEESEKFKPSARPWAGINK
eukprot:scaffold17433_cov52-Cyclotella_meneghiniana.AAC.1